MVLRNKTDSVISNYKRRQANGFVSHELERSKASLVPESLGLSLRTRALSFLVSTLVPGLNGDQQTSNDHREFLKSLLVLYENSPSDSTIVRATTWLSVVVMGTCSKGKPYFLEGILLSDALGSVNEALMDPTQSGRDETLGAVLALQFGEHMRYQRYKVTKSSTVHQSGAEALVAKRGTSNFRTATSLDLFSAVRHNAVDLELSGSTRLKGYDMWAIPQHCQTQSPHNPAVELDFYGTEIIRIASLLEKMGPAENFLQFSDTKLQLSEILINLSSWESHAPEDWLPQMEGTSSFRYPTPDISYTYGRLYLLKLKTFHLMQELDAKANIAYFSELEYHCALEWIDRIIASEPSFFVDASQAIRFCLKVDTCQRPQCSVHQCLLTSGRGIRLLDETLERLHHCLSQALATLPLPEYINSEYRERMSWVLQEMETIKLAFPLSPPCGAIEIGTTF